MEYKNISHNLADLITGTLIVSDMLRYNDASQKWVISVVKG